MIVSARLVAALILPVALSALGACSQILDDRYVIHADARQLVFAEDRQAGTSATITYVTGESSAPFREMVKHVRFDCDAGRLADTAITVTLPDGSVTGGRAPAIEWDQPSPDTTSAKVLAFGCDDAAARGARTWNSIETIRRRYAELRADADA